MPCRELAPSRVSVAVIGGNCGGGGGGGASSGADALCVVLLAHAAFHVRTRADSRGGAADDYGRGTRGPLR
jgi:hypothetical protein